MTFKIEEKIHELTDGYFTLIIKYSVAFMMAWMVGILIVFTYPCFAWSGEKYPDTLIFINDYNIINWALSVIVLFFYSKRLFKQYENGLLIEADFQATLVQLSIINTLTGKVKKVEIKYEDFSISQDEKNSSLMGKQRIIQFYQKEQLLTSLNVDLSAWKRNSDIDNFLLKITEFKSISA